MNINKTKTMIKLITSNSESILNGFLEKFIDSNQTINIVKTDFRTTHKTDRVTEYSVLIQYTVDVC